MRTRVVHCKREAEIVARAQRKGRYVYVGRPSPWGNPFSHLPGTLAQFRVATRAAAIRSYRRWLRTQPQLLAALPTLRGKVLGCWCAPQACHAEVLARLAERTR
jgi:hypothetical protein